jgi:hypothetical protein
LQISFLRGASTFLCTLGFNAIRAGITSAVTNSHCTATQGGVEGTIFHQATIAAANANRIGLETADPNYFVGGACPVGRRCRYSDSSAMRVPHPLGPAVTTSRGRIARPALGAFAWNGVNTFRIVSELAGNAIIGELLTKVGRTSGRTQGRVTASCVNVNQSGTLFTMLCQDQASYGGQPGDSGSPVFRIINAPAANDVRLYGINWGSTTYSPMRNIQRATELGALTTCAVGFAC